MILRDELMQLDSKTTQAREHVATLRERQQKLNRPTQPDEWPEYAAAQRAALGVSLVDLSGAIRDAEQRAVDLEEQRALIVAELDALERRPEVRAAAGRLAETERALRSANAAAAKVLADVVLPALSKLREAHEKVAAARVTLRSASADLARACGEAPDFMYGPSGLTFSEVPVPDGAAGTAQLVALLLSNPKDLP